MRQSPKLLTYVVVLVALLGAVTLVYRGYRSHRNAQTQAAIDRQLDSLAAPARRSTPVSLRPDKR